MKNFACKGKEASEYMFYPGISNRKINQTKRTEPHGINYMISNNHTDKIARSIFRNCAIKMKVIIIDCVMREASENF